MNTQLSKPALLPIEALEFTPGWLPMMLLPRSPCHLQPTSEAYSYEVYPRPC